MDDSDPRAGAGQDPADGPAAPGEGDPEGARAAPASAAPAAIVDPAPAGGGAATVEGVPEPGAGPAPAAPEVDPARHAGADPALARAEVAAAGVEAAPPLAGAAGRGGPPGPQGAGQETVTLGDACARLRVTPDTLRRVIEEYGGAVPGLPAAGTAHRLPVASLPLLQAIVRWRSEGQGRQAILERARRWEEGWRGAEAQRGPDGPADTAAVPPPPPPLDAGALPAELARLHEELRRTEERRAEDRDRLLTALVRTQQELQQLRHEIASGRSRRERRRGWWARLFG